jgi:peptide/nickel transport system substrate-binding protein
LIDRLGARNFAALQKESGRRGFDMIDSGPSLEYAFLVFNLGGSPGSDGRRKAWQQVSFRQAVSSAIDRDAMVRVVYLGRASAMESPVPPGNSRWIDKNLPAPSRSATRARGLLAKGGFKWGRDGALLDDAGRAVEFSILISNSNPQRQQMAAMIQEDLRQIGIRVNVTPMEYRSFLDRIQQQHDFDATIVSLQATDADPNPDMALWLSSGANHLWNPRQKQPATAWEAEIDRIMRRQLVTANYAERKKLFDRVQEIAVEYRPLIALVSPNLLAGARKGLGNFRPAPILPYGLANIEQLYWQGIPSAGSVQ